MLIQSLRDSERPHQGYTFKAIPEDAIPSPDFPNWEGAMMSGLSPRSAQRLKLQRFLPLPDIPLVRKFLRWHTHPVKFTFQVMKEDQWKLLAKADSSVLWNSFERNGFPPLFWQFQVRLAPLLKRQPSSFREDNSSDRRNSESSSSREEEGDENQGSLASNSRATNRRRKSSKD